MSAEPLTTSTRYFDPEITKVYFVPDIEDKESPSRTELDAGTDLSGEVADLSGWMVEANDIETPDLGSRFTGNIPGRTSAEDSSLTLYASQDGDDARAVLPRGEDGFIVWLDGGDEEGNKMDVFPVRVSSVGKERSVSDEAARLQVQFSITSEPAEDVDVPSDGSS